jgi:hypothetical protein
MLQVLNYMFRNPGNDNVKVNLLYANQSECFKRTEMKNELFIYLTISMTAIFL